jgi:hypothetical protein
LEHDRQQAGAPVLGTIIAYIVTWLLVRFGYIGSPRALAWACFAGVMGYAVLGGG